MGKKLLKVFACVALAVLLAFSAVGCSGANWSGKVTLTEPGNVVSNGGFIAETEKYIYFINGVEVSTAKNKFGEPTKGSIMVADKASLATAEVKAQVLVPKIIANGDLNAGIYLYGGEVYYATPSTKKDSNGVVANTHLDFCSTKLDGSAKTTTYITVEGNATEFRFVEKAGVVYIVYYNGADKKFFSYNTSDKSSVEIVSEPASYNFIANESISDAVLVYTVTGKDINNVDDTTFNQLYYYTVGAEKATLLYDGSKNAAGDTLAIPVKYAVKLVYGKYIFYTTTQTKDAEIIKTYGATVADFIAKKEAVTYDKADYIADTTLLIDLKSGYVVDSGYIAKITSENGKILNKKTLINKCDATTLLFTNGDYIYYLNANAEIARISLVKVVDKAEKVSKGAVKKDWYDIRLIGNYVMFIDSSTLGCNYVNYIDITQTPKLDDNKTEKDDKDDFYYLEKINFIGEINSADKVVRVTTKISALSSITSFKVEDKKIEQTKDITEARADFDALTKKQKKEISKENVAILEKFELYLKINEKLLVLKEDFDDGVTITADNKASYQAKIDEIDKLIKDNDLQKETTSLYIENGMYSKQEIQKLIKAFKA